MVWLVCCAMSKLVFFVSGILCAYQFCFGGVCDVMFCVLFLGVCFLGGYFLGEMDCCVLMLF